MGDKGKKMSEPSAVQFEEKCEVLSTIWEDLDNHPQFIDFYKEWGDFALPLASAVANALATVNELGALHIHKAWENLCVFLDLPDSEVSDFVYGFVD